MAYVDVDWKPEFPPPLDDVKGYDGRLATIGEALKRPEEKGGWSRDTKPSIVVVYDPSKKNHIKAIGALESDNRFKAATRLFNCFKVDARAVSKKPRESVELRAYLPDGTLVGSVAGTRRLPRAWNLVADAFEKTHKQPLSRIVPWMERMLGTHAYIQNMIDHHQKKLICDHCGGTNTLTIKVVHDLKKRRDDYAEKLAKFLSHFEG
ncbi:MAG: hypothetical protein CL908_18760 [Deltaproteobacteria bacterium]|nr:hypothetical protein [Deltaproteobacteria bacterium]